MVAIPDLWPSVKFDTLAPATILRRQVEFLQGKGQGVLDAELTTITGQDDFEIHRLDLIAPLIQGQRYRVLVATHRSEYYPLQVEADCFRPKSRTVTTPGIAGVSSILGPQSRVEDLTWPPVSDWRVIARSQLEFLQTLGQVLGSDEVRSVIESFVARSNELQVAKSSLGSPEPETGASGVG